jgi:holo-ACP synthase
MQTANISIAYEITLEQMLKARDERAEKQKHLIKEYKKTLISFTVNIPGANKRTPVSGKIFREGYQSLIKRLLEKDIQILYRETRDLVTGPEAYVVVDEDAGNLKIYLIEMESQHPLGRLFDFDVIGLEGYPISRKDVGHPPRKCLLCEQDAHACSRSRSHSAHELITRIHAMAHSYFKGQQC